MRIDQKLRRIEPQAPFGSLRPVHTVAVALTGTYPSHVHMPLERGAIVDVQSPLAAHLVE